MNPPFKIPTFASNSRQAGASIPIPPPPLPPTFPPPPNIPISPLLSFPEAVSSQQFPHSNYTFQAQTLSPPPWVTSRPPTLVVQQPTAQQTPQNALDSWIESRVLNEKTTTKTTSKPKVFVVRQKLNAAYRLIKGLENDSRTLNVMVKTVALTEWNHKVNEIEQKKKELMNILNELQYSKEEVAELKEKISKQVKKRARLRRQTLKREEQLKNDNENRQNLHFRIVSWQKEMQEIVERSKREQELQQEADAVLWVVRQSKSEARRQLDLLIALQELREARVRRHSAAGQSTSTVEIETFNTVTERLKVMWTRRLADCMLEEQVLRGMLASADVQQDPIDTYKKLVLNEWQLAIFGSCDTLLSEFNLIDIRHSWDQFVVKEDTVLASSVPPAWVLPCPPVSDQWAALLKYQSHSGSLQVSH